MDNESHLNVPSTFSDYQILTTEGVHMKELKTYLVSVGGINLFTKSKPALFCVKLFLLQVLLFLSLHIYPLCNSSALQFSTDWPIFHSYCLP